MTDTAGVHAENAPDAANPARLRVWLLLLNFLPLLHVLALGGVAFLTIPAWARIAAVLGGLYLGPPLVARLLLLPGGRFPMDSPAFFRWWASAQLQMIFNRLPLLEEILRVVPGLYSNWLRLWGARIGRLTFWAPGVAVLDRGYLNIGDDVVFGAGVRLNGHVLARNHSGRLELALGPIKIGSGASIGGYSLLTAGTEIAPGETTRAHLLSPPFTLWRDGRRYKGESESHEDLS